MIQQVRKKAVNRVLDLTPAIFFRPSDVIEITNNRGEAVQIIQTETGPVFSFFEVEVEKPWQMLARSNRAVVTMFIRDMCEQEPGAVIPSAELYDVFCQWCTQHATHTLTRYTFGLTINNCKLAGNTRIKTGGQRVQVFTGIKLKTNGR